MIRILNIYSIFFLLLSAKFFEEMEQIGPVGARRVTWSHIIETKLLKSPWRRRGSGSEVRPAEEADDDEVKYIFLCLLL